MTTSAVIYARFSTTKQDARSLDDQIRRCTEYAARSGLTVVDSYADEAVSGATLDREHFQRLLSDVKRSKGRAFKVVLVDDLSRLSRDLFDMGRIVFQDLLAVGVRVVDCMTGVASDSPQARLMFTSVGMGNDQFLQMVKMKTHGGLDGRALAGFWTGGRVYGYRTNPEEKPTDPEHPRKVMVIYEPEAKLVRRIFGLHADGLGYAAIANVLNTEEIPAPYDHVGKIQKKLGRGWRASSVRSLLSNERYGGRFTWNKRKFLKVGGSKIRNAQHRDESEWRVSMRPELAIITPDEFEATQKRIKERNGRPLGSTSHKEREHRVHLLSGIAVCGVCGAGLGIIGQRTKNGVRYVTMGCAARHSRGTAICPSTATISERKLNELVIETVRKMLFAPGAIASFAQQFKAQVKAGTEAVPVDTLSAQIALAEKTVSNLADALARVGFSEVLGGRLKAEEAKLKALTVKQAAQPPAAPKAAPVPTAKVLTAYLTGMFEALVSNPELGRKMLRAHFEGSPPKLTRKKEGPDSVIHAKGAFHIFVPDYSETCVAGVRSAPFRVTLPLDVSVAVKGGRSKGKRVAA